ncbi:hypothetical protein C5167_001606, partial [Papaver somniferum]
MMINKQQAVVDGSIEPGGHQSRLGMVTTIRSGEKDAQMFNSHIKLRERGNRLDMESMNNQFFCASGDGNSRDDNQSDEVDDGIPSINLDIETQKRIIQPWKYCLIGKVVGKTFENPADYRFALLEGPWFIGGHHLSMRRWTPNFKPFEASVNITVVWARLPELPLEYFDKAVLERIGTVNSAITEESFGPWMLVEKKKNKIRVVGAHVANQKVQDNSKGVTNRFASLDEQNSFDQTDLNVAHQRSINAQNNNSCNFNGAMHGGNYEGFTKKLQNKEVNDNNSGIGNKGVVQASLRKSFNHKNINTTNKGSGKGINGGQFNDQMPICKGKGIMQASTSVSNNQENGRKQPTDSNVFKSLSRAIGGAVEGRGFSSEASTGRTSGNAESSDRDNNRTNLKGGYQTATNGRHCSDEKSVESCITNSSTYTRADGLEFIFGQNPSNSDSIKNLTFKLDTHGPEEFLNHGKEELECVSRMWQESTTLEVELAPMVETPALVKSPSDILKFEMHFTTHLDAEMLYQRQFKTRFNPLLELNKAAVARRMEMQVPRGPSRSVSIPKCFNNLSMKILVRNCRGAARLSFISVMKKLIKRHK